MNPYLTFLLFFLFSVYLLETIAELLNLRELRAELPAEFQDILDPGKYHDSRRYQEEGTRFELIRNSIYFIAVIGFTLLGGFNRIDLWVRSLEWSPTLTGLAFVAALSGLRLLLGLPFSIFHTFFLEEKYGFNKTTPQTFFFDLVKGLLLSSILGGLIFAGIFYFFQAAGPSAWLYSWIGVTAVQLLLAYLAPAVILPLFNQFTPLPAGPLKDAIESFAKSRKFRLEGIYTMDSSRRSTKSNAFFTGFGRFRKLVLFDTLISKHTVPELVSVLAHEIGHFELKHIVKSIVASIFYSGLIFYAFGFFLNNPALFEAFQMENISVYASIVFVAFLYSPISRILSIFTQMISRKHEYEADTFAVITFGNPDAMISALKKMSVDHLSHLTPHPLKVLLDYSHPPILARIRALKKYRGQGV